MEITKILWRSVRPSFLVLTPACVGLGTSTAFASMKDANIVTALLVLLGAMAAHISVNLLNEYYDFKSGLDQLTQRSPFNGGSGALVEYPQMALGVLGLGLGMLVLTITIGTWFIYQSGIAILLIGALGVALIATYTQWVNRLPTLCLIAPGLGFGIFMVIGTHIALVKEASLLVVVVSMVPFFLVNNLLLVNQIPDLEADRQAGRNHYLIAYGVGRALRIYLSFVFMAYGLIIAGILNGLLSWLALLALLAMPLSLFTAYGIYKHGQKIGEYLPFMATNAAAAVMVPILLAIAIFIGK